LATGEDDHPGRVRAPPADDHALASVAIPLRVRPKNMVGIVVLPRDQPIQVRVVPDKIEMNH
jgi:hypothetical protein